MSLDPVILISLSAFLAVGALATALFVMFGAVGNSDVEDRLQVLAGQKSPDEPEARGLMKEDLMAAGAGVFSGVSKAISRRFSNLGLYFQQADSPISFEQFLGISLLAGLMGVAGAMIAKAPAPLYPVVAIVLAFLPMIWLSWRRKSRFNAFAKRLPEALELIARALRSGHSLNSGLNMVAEEMPAPIGTEFGIAFEEQNLGVPVEQTLKNMVKRMPNLDLKFFATAVAIQRQTGGDLAEILDKIGYVVRERFKILGAVQALTGEGRLSGVVLMAMPIAIFFAVYYLNQEYVMLLFTTEIGKKMIGGAIVMQILGAIVIRKIIDIKV
jgi:tight adherence protein B